VRVTLVDNGKIDRIWVRNERCEDRDSIRNQRCLFSDLEELLDSNWRMVRRSITSHISPKYPPSASTGICFRNIHPLTSFRHNCSKPVRHPRNTECRCSDPPESLLVRCRKQKDGRLGLRAVPRLRPIGRGSVN
jgi:hypothetical protein